ncbi:hypothetical protein ANCCEY_12706 [Ancylostoma ceylanicum]|uniref:Uncharacterized protein n=1 Tax=Ancylostoma ceylanicum TaxID=53326 RepID=A0A0D6L8N3_9BILA|nr:hypothetical protein ANCCEY_12706 [Ancylostoma ceylanicum]
MEKYAYDPRNEMGVNSKVTRSRSLSDLSGYYRWSDKYKPQWHTVYQYTPYRWRRDWELYDDYWYDRYYYFSPLYSSYYPWKRYYYR